MEFIYLSVSSIIPPIHLPFATFDGILCIAILRLILFYFLFWFGPFHFCSTSLLSFMLNIFSIIENSLFRSWPFIHSIIISNFRFHFRFKQLWPITFLTPIISLSNLFVIRTLLVLTTRILNQKHFNIIFLLNYFFILLLHQSHTLWLISSTLHRSYISLRVYCDLLHFFFYFVRTTVFVSKPKKKKLQRLAIGSFIFSTGISSFWNFDI